MEKEIKIWYDKEGDYLEVIFEKKAGSGLRVSRGNNTHPDRFQALSV